jgi:hypothetical protein
MTDMGKDGVILDNLSKAIAPLKEALDPYKTHEGDFERGKPKTHDKQSKWFLFPSIYFIFV